MDGLSDLAPTIRAVAEGVGPSVVRIGHRGGRGCGVVIGADHVLTNAHNLRGPDTLVTGPDGQGSPGQVLAVDVDGDLAVIEVDTAGVPPVRWRDEPADLGEPVFAVARGATGQVRVTFGTVSATERAFRGPRGRRITGSLEHTAPLVRGSSGSAITDADGRVIGLNTNRLGDGFYLALPTDDDLRDRLRALQQGAEPRRPRLGVGLASAAVAARLRRSVGLPDREGLLVRAVEPDSPADRAGIQQGDLLVGAGERSTPDADTLYEVLDGAGAELVIQVVRGADELEVTVSFDG